MTNICLQNKKTRTISYLHDQPLCIWLKILSMKQPGFNKADFKRNRLQECLKVTKRVFQNIPNCIRTCFLICHISEEGVYWAHCKTPQSLLPLGSITSKLVSSFTSLIGTWTPLKCNRSTPFMRSHLFVVYSKTIVYVCRLNIISQPWP